VDGEYSGIEGFCITEKHMLYVTNKIPRMTATALKIFWVIYKNIEVKKKIVTSRHASKLPSCGTQKVLTSPSQTGIE